jgi:2-polyprenyl-3-methyl-5-hydroxy-6-metoxy-1,4-benzoquinol methylase
MKGVRWLINGVRKAAAGLRPFGESVWPGVRSDLFVAHESIYELFAPQCIGKRVLDLGCGTGYGSARIARDAKSVLAVDVDRRSIRYAQKHYAAPNLRFETADIESLVLRESFDVVTASNSLEHLHDPRRAFAVVRDVIENDGVFLVAVPPVRNEHDLRLHNDAAYHVSVLSVDEWAELFTSTGFDVKRFLHRAREGVDPDFFSQRTSRLRVDDFHFIETTREGLRMQPTITAIFSASPAARPR